MFVLGEFAFITVDRARVEQLAGEGDRAAGRVLGALRRLSFELSSAQLGITIASIGLGFVAEPVISRVTGPALDAIPGVEVDPGAGVAVATALALATVTQMIVGELVPKNWAIARPLGAARLVVVPFGWFAAVFGPLIARLNGAANRLVRLFGIEPVEELASVRSLEELDLLIRSSVREGTLDPAAFPLLARAISFGDKTAGDALVPRTAVVALAREATLADLVQVALETGHSRFPVHEGDLDDVVGMVHVKDAFRVPRRRWGEARLSEILLDVPLVPESRDLAPLLVELTGSGLQLAAVIDEYGGTAGIITTEDILEEIVGHIEDEYDRDREVVPPGPGAHLVPGISRADEVEEQVGFRLPAGEFETLAGFLLSVLGRVPAPGDEVEHEGWRFTVLTLDGLRIDQVRVVPPSGPSGEGRS